MCTVVLVQVEDKNNFRALPRKFCAGGVLPRPKIWCHTLNFLLPRKNFYSDPQPTRPATSRSTASTPRQRSCHAPGPEP